MWLSAVACQPVDAPVEAVGSQTYFPISIGGSELQLQLALKPAEQQKGLMYRESLDNDHGMLFLFDRPDKRGFWFGKPFQVIWKLSIELFKWKSNQRIFRIQEGGFFLQLLVQFYW